jgi:hypothetical protein
MVTAMTGSAESQGVASVGAGLEDIEVCEFLVAEGGEFGQGGSDGIVRIHPGVIGWDGSVEAFEVFDCGQAVHEPADAVSGSESHAVEQALRSDGVRVGGVGVDHGRVPFFIVR